MLKFHIIVVTPFSQNCTLLWDDESHDAVLIDAGGDTAKLVAEIQKKKLNLVALWLTHGHLDHVGSVGELAKKYDIPVIGPHEADDFWLQALPMQAQMFNFPKPTLFKPTKWLAHGDTLSLGKYTFNVRFTPGHTPGHVVIYSKDLKLVWTGDVLFHGSIGRTDFPQGDHATLLRSIQEQLFTLPDDTEFISGHGEMSTLGFEKKHNPFVSGQFG